MLKDTEEEGCLSVDGVWGMVKRPRHITVQATNERGEHFVLEAKGLMARTILHEYDHIEGILFVDRVKRFTKGQHPAKKSK